MGFNFVSSIASIACPASRAQEEGYEDEMFGVLHELTVPASEMEH